MPSLVDITPLTETVAGVPVKGISGRGLGTILARFPVVRKLLSERRFDAEELIAVAPDAVAEIIAAGIGKPGDAEQITAADAMPVGLQVEFLAAIVKVSFPNGLSAAVGALTSLMSSLPGANEDQAVGAPALN
jgi:hypothetical protein